MGFVEIYFKFLEVPQLRSLTLDASLIDSPVSYNDCSHLRIP